MGFYAQGPGPMIPPCARRETLNKEREDAEQKEMDQNTKSGAQEQMMDINLSVEG